MFDMFLTIICINCSHNLKDTVMILFIVITLKRRGMLMWLSFLVNCYLPWNRPISSLSMITFKRFLVLFFHVWMNLGILIVCKLNRSIVIRILFWYLRLIWNCPRNLTLFFIDSYWNHSTCYVHLELWRSNRQLWTALCGLYVLLFIC